MPERATIAIRVNGQPVSVPHGATVAVALLLAGAAARRSRMGEPRAPLCGMGVCFECRAVVDGVAHQRTCTLLCARGMEVETQCA